MNNYKPDRWIVLKIDEVYKVFGVWMGGYLSGDSWRMNSGIESIELKDSHYIIKGYSGSEYKCHKNGYGTSGYGASVLDGIIDKGQENKIDIKVLGYDEFIEWFK